MEAVRLTGGKDVPGAWARLASTSAAVLLLVASIAALHRGEPSTVRGIEMMALPAVVWV